MNDCLQSSSNNNKAEDVLQDLITMADYFANILKPYISTVFQLGFNLINNEVCVCVWGGGGGV